MISLFDIIGVVGVVVILLSYLLLQLGRLPADGLLYSLLNLVGAFAIFISLLFDWNLSAGLIEIFWILISLFGILKVLKKK